jgi:predicted transcriptional regulator
MLLTHLIDVKLKKRTMKKLTRKEKEIMELYWQNGPMFVKELLEFYDEPRPHFNTLSTTVRILEKKGYLDHKQFGTSYQYFPTVTEKEYGRSSLAGVIKSYFDDSYLNAVSSFVKDEKISVEELKELIEQIEHS